MPARWAATLLAALISPGCLAVSSRTGFAGSCDDLVVYQGAVLFWHMGETAEDTGSVLLGLVALVDLGPTLVFDTALIPFDLLVWPFGGYAALWPGWIAEL